ESDNSKRQCENAVRKQHERHILFHGYCCSTIGGIKFLLISSIVAKISSIPCFFSAEVKKMDGTSSNQAKSAFLNLAIFWSDFTPDCLSAFVNTNKKGNPCSPNQQQNSKSIFCGSSRLSMSTKIHCRFS